jgi:ATP-binding cassette subfamily B protein
LWQKKIAHVPQNVYLLDATFAENIAFGLPIEHINLEQVILAAKLAHISNFIESRANSYASMVGERGIQLSGGQLQRIGIARAFYKQSEVIIFDEATSALDDLTENQIFHSISLLPRTVTILIVSHRPQTLKNCNRIIELSEGNLIDSTRKLGLLNKNS